MAIYSPIFSLAAVLMVALLAPSAHGQDLLSVLYGGSGGSTGGSGSLGSGSLGSGATGGSLSSLTGLTGGSGGSQGLQPSGPVANFNSNALSSLTGSSSSGTNNINSLGAGLSAIQGHCNRTERQVLFRSCAMSFGMRYMQVMQGRRTCPLAMLNCREVDDLIRCANSQPITTVSNKCWVIVDKTLTSFFRQYNMPCTFDDLKTKCQHTSTDLLPLSDRQQTGQGINTNPMAVIQPIIQRVMMRVMMMMMMGGGGGMFGA